MSMFDAIEISGSGLSVQRARMDVIAENIANAETTRTPEGGPYRRLQLLVAPAERPAGGVEAAGLVVDNSPLRQVYDPSHADADAEGYVQMPNVDVAIEMVDMLAASRAYEANARALRVAREMAQDAINILV